MPNDVQPKLRASFAAAAVALTTTLLVACGTPSAEVSIADAQRACDPLAAVQSSALQLLATVPVSTSPKRKTDATKDPIVGSPQTADGLAALASRLLPVADQLDQVASKAGAQSGDQQNLVTGILGAEIALRRTSRALKARAFSEASLASDDFAKNAKTAGLTCAAPLGDGTLPKLQALPTTPQ